jgi:hypothetical protein
MTPRQSGRERLAWWLVRRSYWWWERSWGGRVAYRMQMTAHGLLGNGWKD